eukprot:TRINITY_DN3561_c0_g1_i1.p1 TRINITY_DN3561_c0_g1~~TRINITY_DN3561_c0_g1_i1.p1  ORF type:complete len:332 (+),score=104.74 TRINITY_DN3561_c0_g1_i1:89-1084(+)
MCIRDSFLELANLGLSQLQIATIVSASSRDAKGMVLHHKFVSVAAEMIAEMFHANMLSDRRRGQPAPQDVNDLSNEELHTFLSRLFSGAMGDKEEGAPTMLAPADFKRVLLSTDVGFTPEQMRRMLVEADESYPLGLIDCDAFVEAAVKAIGRMASNPGFKDQERLREREAEELAKDFSVHAHSREQLEVLLGELFREQDEAEEGTVGRDGLYVVVHELERRLGLERREVNALMISADDEEGRLNYSEFLLLAYDVLRQSILDILIDETPQSTQLTEYIVKICTEKDQNHSGELPAADLKLVLSACDLKLSKGVLEQLMQHTISDLSLIHI